MDEIRKFKRVYRRLARIRILRFIIGELIASFLLFFCIETCSYTQCSQGAATINGFLTMLLLLYIFIPISNCQVNPFVTICFWIDELQNVVESIVSVVCQIIAMFVASILLNVTFTDEVLVISDNNYTWKQAGTDAIGTACMITVLMVTTYRKGDPGIYVSAVFTIGANVLPSGMVCNPVMTLMRLFVNSPNGMSITSVLKYILFQCIGFAAGLFLGQYYFVQGEKEEKSDHEIEGDIAVEIDMKELCNDKNEEENNENAKNKEENDIKEVKDTSHTD